VVHCAPSAVERIHVHVNATRANRVTTRQREICSTGACHQRAEHRSGCANSTYKFVIGAVTNLLWHVNAEGGGSAVAGHGAAQTCQQIRHNVEVMVRLVHRSTSYIQVRATPQP
jgi:curli biogenesis system outer membrane secretion channel CsgG